MNGMDRIKERILEDAKREADRILAEAQDKAERIKQEKGERAAAAKERLARDYETRTVDQKRRMISVAQLDMRKKVLAVKQETIDKAFARCLETIGTMPAPQYREMMEALLLQAVVSGDEEVVLSAGDEARLGSDFIAGVNGKLTATGRKGALRLSPEKGRFQGGFILKSGGMEMNNSFESILRIVRDEIEPQVAEMLF